METETSDRCRFAQYYEAKTQYNTLSIESIRFLPRGVQLTKLFCFTPEILPVGWINLEQSSYKIYVRAFLGRMGTSHQLSSDNSSFTFLFIMGICVPIVNHYSYENQNSIPMQISPIVLTLASTSDLRQNTKRGMCINVERLMTNLYGAKIA